MSLDFPLLVSSADIMVLWVLVPKVFGVVNLKESDECEGVPLVVDLDHLDETCSHD
jgi:hypothetical protein